MIRILARLIGRLARLAVWFALWFAIGWLAGRLTRWIRELVDVDDGEPAPRYYVGPDDPDRPSLGRAIAAADELARHSPGPSPAIRLEVPSLEELRIPGGSR